MKKKNANPHQVDAVVSTNPNNFFVCMYMLYQGKCYSAHVDIPPEKHKMEYIRQQTSGLSSSTDRKIKELLFGPK